MCSNYFSTNHRSPLSTRELISMQNKNKQQMAKKESNNNPQPTLVKRHLRNVVK